MTHLCRKGVDRSKQKSKELANPPNPGKRSKERKTRGKGRGGEEERKSRVVAFLGKQMD